MITSIAVSFADQSLAGAAIQRSGADPLRVRAAIHMLGTGHLKLKRRTAPGDEHRFILTFDGKPEAVAVNVSEEQMAAALHLLRLDAEMQIQRALGLGVFDQAAIQNDLSRATKPS